MLDENLPAFFLKPSSSGIKHHESILLSYQGSDPAPCYSLHHADPVSTLAAHKNCYAAALFDAYNDEVLYGEVLARPDWTQPTLSQEEIRRTREAGAVPPPPQPVLPGEFVVQLYGPDQQVRVELQPGKWGSSDSWSFSMPQTSFRTPSASNLDKSSSDPVSLDTTPKINFIWRKESKLSRDLICYMTGRSTDKQDKKNKGRKDPDIAVGLWRSMRELTIYEPNLQRVEMEDPKGLEVVMLLSAIVIKDLYFGNKDRLGEIFNVSDAPGRKLSAGGRKLSNPKQVQSILGMPAPLATHPPARPGQQHLPSAAAPPRVSSANDAKRNSLPRLQTTSPRPAASAPPPVADPRQQWQLDAETARLKAAADAEARLERERAAKVRREQEKRDEAEAKRLRKIFEQEQREEQRRQADIDRETERLRKLYGVQALPAQPNSSRPRPSRGHGALSSSSLQPIPQGRPALNPIPPPPRGSNGLYVQPSASSSAVMMSGANNSLASGQGQPKKKKSFFGLRSSSSEDAANRRLAKKQSAMW